MRSAHDWLRRCCRFLRFELWVQEGTAYSALTNACPRPVAKSFLHVGDQSCGVRTLPAHASKTSGRHVCGTSLRPSSLERSVHFRRLCRVLSNNRESCAWSCGALVRSKKNPFHRCHHLEKQNWDVRVLTLSGSQRRARCACQLLACRLGRFLNVELDRSSVVAIEGFEVGGGGCFNNRSERVSKGCFGKRPAITASCIIVWMRGLAAMSAAMSHAVNPGKSLSRDLYPTSS